jgi:hypothetical protein
MSDRRVLVRRLAPAALLAILALSLVVPEPDLLEASGDADAAAAFAAAVDALPDAPTVLVGFDPDVGTYAEIRPAVRTALAGLLAANARLATVTLTAEGRALLGAELDRLERGEANPQRLLDLGFVPGAEAALVAIARGPSVPDAASGAIARRVRDAGADAFDAVLVIGGNDIGPRTWVEQYLPRVEPVPLLAITPTALLPEVLPYLETGQIDALLGTSRAAIGYAGLAEVGTLERLADRSSPPALAMLAGIVAAAVVFVPSWIDGIRRTGRRASGPRDDAAR